MLNKIRKKVQSTFQKRQLLLYHCCLESLSTAQILERHFNDFFEINSKQMIKIAKTVKLKTFSKW